MSVLTFLFQELHVVCEQEVRHRVCEQLDLLEHLDEDYQSENEVEEPKDNLPLAADCSVVVLAVHVARILS